MGIPQTVLNGFICSYVNRIDEEYYQLIAKAEECINSLHKADIISLKEARQDEAVQKVMQLLCILKGKVPTWNNACYLLNPLTFKIEFSMTDVSKLRAENIARAQEWMNIHHEVLNTPYVEKTSLPAGRLLDWATNVLMLYKYKCGRAYKANPTNDEQVSLPKVLRTAAPRLPGYVNLKLTGTKKQFEAASVRRQGEYGIRLDPSRQLRSEDIRREDSKGTRKLYRTTTKMGDKKGVAGRYITGKTFALSGQFQVNRPEIPVAILKGVGKQKALIMKAMEDEKAMQNKLGSAKDSARLGVLLDKLAENKESQ